MENSIKKEIISGVGKALNDFNKIKSLYENHLCYDNIFYYIDTDDVFTKVVDLLDENSAEIYQLDLLFRRSIYKDTYKISTDHGYCYSGVALDLATIIRFLEKTHKLLK